MIPGSCSFWNDELPKDLGTVSYDDLYCLDTTYRKTRQYHESQPKSYPPRQRSRTNYVQPTLRTCDTCAFATVLDPAHRENASEISSPLDVVKRLHRNYKDRLIGGFGFAKVRRAADA